MGPRIEFQRSRLTREGFRIAMFVVAAIVIAAGFGGGTARVVVGSLVVLQLPFALLFWWRVGQRLVVDAESITVVNRFGAPRVVSWLEYAATDPANRELYLPRFDWNGREVATPAEILDREPSRLLAPAGLGFDLVYELLAMRAADPHGVWLDQLAIVFRARALLLKIGTNAKVPKASVHSA